MTTIPSLRLAEADRRCILCTISEQEVKKTIWRRDLNPKQTRARRRNARAAKRSVLLSKTWNRQRKLDRELPGALRGFGDIADSLQLTAKAGQVGSLFLGQR